MSRFFGDLNGPDSENKKESLGDTIELVFSDKRGPHGTEIYGLPEDKEDGQPDLDGLVGDLLDVEQEEADEDEHSDGDHEQPAFLRRRGELGSGGGSEIGMADLDERARRRREEEVTAEDIRSMKVSGNEEEEQPSRRQIFSSITEEADRRLGGGEPPNENPPRSSRTGDSSREDNRQPRRRRIPFPLVVLLLFLTAIITGSAYYFYNMGRDAIPPTEPTAEQQQAIDNAERSLPEHEPPVAGGDQGSVTQEKVDDLAYRVNQLSDRFGQIDNNSIARDREINASIKKLQAELEKIPAGQGGQGIDQVRSQLGLLSRAVEQAREIDQEQTRAIQRQEVRLNQIEETQRLDRLSVKDTVDEALQITVPQMIEGSVAPLRGEIRVVRQDVGNLNGRVNELEFQVEAIGKKFESLSEDYRLIVEFECGVFEKGKTPKEKRNAPSFAAAEKFFGGPVDRKAVVRFCEQRFPPN